MATIISDHMKKSGGRVDVSHRFAIVSTVLGIVGLVGYTVFIVVYTTGTSAIPVGIFERLAIYPVDVVQLMIGTALLARWARRPADVILEHQATTQPAATSATSQQPVRGNGRV